MDRAEIVHQNFLTRVAKGDFPARHATVSLAASGLDKVGLVNIFYSQVISRQLDRTSRHMQAEGEGFYTIASSGHEGNAAIAAAFRPDDMAFLHYRDAAFQIQRALMVPGQTPVWDMLLSFAASADDPVSGGRHKVLGSKSLFIPPQTSTIASHLPKAVGAAFSIGLAKRLHTPDQQLADDGVVLCSFGDASANHSTAQGAFNSASWTAWQGGAMPLVFICEDNGIGISTKTPGGWIRAAFSARPALKYFSCDGLDILETHKTAREVVSYVRRHKRPAFLHINCVRLYGHAGADVQTAYLDKKEIEAAEANDPLLHSARLLVENDILTPNEILGLYQETGERVERVAQEVIKRPKLTSASEVAASLIPPKKQLASREQPSADERADIFAGDLEFMKKPQHMARLLSWALSDLMLEHENIVLAGEDIGPKGGVYHVTAKLHSRFGPRRVINTLLDEQSILGLAIGLAHNGFLPIPEIQFLAYLHNAEDQLRGEAATLSFFSNGQYTNPMVVRIAALGYQKGFGGHFHNDNSLAVLRDIPGIIIACPSNGQDAVLMLREAVRLADEEQRIVVFIEPIALYMRRDLHQEGDGKWSFDYPQAGDDAKIALGQIGQYGAGKDLAIISYANGYFLSRQAEKILSEQHGINLRVIDLRWLAPLNEDAILEAIAPCDRVLVVDECRITGSQSEALIAMIVEKSAHAPLLKRVAANDCFIPLGTAAMSTLPSRDTIVDAALELLKRP
ncbi:TTP-dependent protein, related to E1 component of pyruvate/2-oxoglutarate/acetoin dehydrogenase [hydrothermal vent metagenome]|uniref:3-methyl-2-oxobutanoate dehydrogenase (2-methylpropanoyl-transferring) n=1 Tax=hydrothermal vent metagenome TaxID=652676 RepID=A0A3B0TXF9_9ZZZZ